MSNHSTGYCPDPTSWAAVAGALDRAGIDRPDGFTVAVVFRRCLDCGERNLVRDDDYVCALCGAELPEDVEPRLMAQPLSGPPVQSPETAEVRATEPSAQPRRGGLR